MEPDSGGPRAYNGDGYPWRTANPSSILKDMADAYEQGVQKYGFKVSEVLCPISIAGCCLCFVHIARNLRFLEKIILQQSRLQLLATTPAYNHSHTSKQYVNVLI